MRWNYYCAQQERERERERIMFEMELLLCAAGEREDNV